MTKEAGPPSNSDVMLLMLQNQQLASRESDQQRDLSHELGVAFLKIGNVYRGLQQSQDEYEDTVQWVQVGLTAVSLGSSVSQVSSAKNGGEIPSAEETSPPGAFDYAKEIYKFGENHTKSMTELDDQHDKLAEDQAKSTSKTMLADAEAGEKAHDGDRKLTEQIIEVIRNPRKNGVAG